MKITTTLRKLQDARACPERYRYLGRSLGGIKGYGLDTPINLNQILQHNGLYDFFWVIRNAIQTSKKLNSLLRGFACDCAERVLLRERDAGREPDTRSWRAVEVARLYVDGKATIKELAIAEHNADNASRGITRNAAYYIASAATCAATSSASSPAISAVFGASSWAAASCAAKHVAYPASSEASRRAENDWQEGRLIMLIEESINSMKVEDVSASLNGGGKQCIYQN